MYPQIVNTAFVAFLQKKDLVITEKKNNVNNFPRTLHNNIKQRTLKKESLG